MENAQWHSAAWSVQVRNYVPLSSLTKKHQDEGPDVDYGGLLNLSHHLFDHVQSLLPELR